ncbi:hypothetical protein GCM10011575_10650 [Microlunatus endophyticus]|uniref:Uncharacterized protein n=1 Tax=Microlunatus endophyticus TaxID=1716077 RepID=A0A917W0Z2_9ACTN|nr:FxsA family protein [Microlunatus endophyticus]GGL54124.1 hypothetical protein GCM10011575_10650 [Microlunatus endophyticus]
MFAGALILGVVDIWLLILIGHHLGALPVVLFMIAEAAAGGWLIRRRWRSAWQRLARTGENRPDPSRLDLQNPGRQVAQAVDTGLVVGGAAALIFPGVITAVLGLLLLLPVTRRVPAAMLNRAIGRRIPDLGDLDGLGGFGGRSRGRGSTGYGEVIEGEVVDNPGPNGTQDPDGPTIIRGEVGDR